ncbi:MAG: inositol 2-dehydrogenase [Hyphomonadaceae bacterium]
MAGGRKVALLGAGRMGQIHGPNAAHHPGLTLAAIVDPNRALAAPLAAQTGAEVAELGAVLADKSIEGIIVASSTDMHLEHAVAALSAGKIVFCEKPVDLDLAKARAAAKTFAGAPFLLGFNRRFDPHFQALKAKIDEGAIGKLETLSLINHDPASPPADFVPRSGGLFKDFTIHDLDLARWLLDEEPSQIFAMASCLVDPEIGRMGDVDTARVMLKTPSGRLCVIANTRRSGMGYDQRVEAFGSNGMANVANVRNDTVEAQNEAGGQSAPVPYNFLARYMQSYAAEVDHFAEMMAGRARPRVGYEDGIAALVLAEAAGLSAKTNAPVDL